MQVETVTGDNNTKIYTSDDNRPQKLKNLYPVTDRICNIPFWPHQIIQSNLFAFVGYK